MPNRGFAAATLAAGLIAGCTDRGVGTVGEQSAGVVYDVDDRTDVYAHPSPELRAMAAEAIAGLFRPSRLDLSDPTEVRVVADSLGDDERLCSDQRFIDQPAAASCSATLIDADLVVTAGHCADTLQECTDRKIVFDFYYEAEGQPATIEASDVFECRQLVVQQNADVDYAVIQLDRPAPAWRRPVAVLDGDAPLTLGSTLTVIGFPSGIPAKIDDGGHVLANDPNRKNTFQASLDTFDSNSGSGVFDEARRLIGILNSGKRDYARRGNCRVVNVLHEADVGADAEKSTYVARAIEDLCASGWETDLCGDTGGWCRPCREEAQCPAGWTCRAHPADPGVTWCAQPCTADAECRADHHCTAGSCAPLGQPRCVDGRVWEENACGRLVAAVGGCDAGLEICVDRGCVPAAPGNGCRQPLEIDTSRQRLEGTFDELIDHQSTGSCGGNGKDRVFSFVVDRPMRLTAQATGFDTLLYLRRTCADPNSEVACDDDSRPPGGRGSRITARLEPGTWFLFLDAYGNAGGDYALDVDFEPLDTPDAGFVPPPPDAGHVVDASPAVPPDAGFEPDAEVPGPGPSHDKSLPEAEEQGCGCRTSAPSGATGLLAGIGLLARRRRSR